MKNRIHELTSWYFSKSAAPYWIILMIDCFIVYASGMAAYYLVYGGYETAVHWWRILTTITIFIPGYLLGFRLFHTYSRIIRYSSSIDLVRIAGAMFIGTCIAIIIHKAFCLHHGFYYNYRAQVLLIAFLIETMTALVMRMMVKLAYDQLIYTSNKIHAFVYGIHEGGEAIAHSIVSDKKSPYVLSGFISDEKTMRNRYMMGVKVYYNDENLIKTMKKNGIKTLFISPLYNESLRNNPTFLAEIVKNGIKVMMQPAEQEWDGKSNIEATQLQEIDIEDLLPRDKIEVDLKAIGELLAGNVVMVTGAAGSIGYELVRQVAKFSPQHLILIDSAETPMHTVRLHMANHYPHIACETFVSSISNKSKMEMLFQRYRPSYVFHAAAYKHVPMMEDNPSEAVQNNIYGTRIMADLAVKYGTKKFVMISTDKAVNPTNVMGCSKRICEIYCQAINNALIKLRKVAEEGKDIHQEGLEENVLSHLLREDGTPGVTQFVTTRFGNVLGSNGSVIPLFRKQIKQGGPVTVTHPDIIRYFMLIPEACRLVLEAGTMGHGGEIFVFDMGQPVRIADLAQRMIDLSGAKNVTIKYTGLRDGEKLYEEVLNDAETTRPTPHPKIMVSAVREYPYTLALKQEEELLEISYSYDDMAIVKKMKEIVPEYKSKHSKYEALD